MNIPNRISVKTMSAPLKRQRASTNPFIEPRNDEMIAAGTTIWNVRHSDGDRACHAPDQFSVVHTCGRFHARAGDASPRPLKLVTTSTYTGIRTSSVKKMSRAYLAVLPFENRLLARGGSRVTGAPRGAVSWGVATVIGASPSG